MSNAKQVEGFRIIVRGTDNEGARKRRVVTVPAVDYADASAQAEAAVQERAALKGLNNLYLTILPPVPGVQVRA